MEQRREERVHSENLLHLFFEDQDQVVKQGMGKTLNMSRTGLLIETGFPLHSGAQASIEIGLEEEIVHVKGKIVHVNTDESGKSEAGIVFSEPDLRIGERLKKKEQEKK